MANDKLRLDLFDKRYEIYSAVCELLGKMDEFGSGVTGVEIATYSAKSHAKFFLLDRPLRDYLDTVFKKAQENRSLTRWLEHHKDSSHPDWASTIAALATIEKWAGDQFMGDSELRRRFDPYLNFATVQLADDLDQQQPG
jgi:hypothetical protein